MYFCKEYDGKGSDRFWKPEKVMFPVGSAARDKSVAPRMSELNKELEEKQEWKGNSDIYFFTMVGNIISEASNEMMLFYSARNLHCPVCY
eukprot:g38852.t1